MTLEFDLNDVRERFGDREYHQTGAGNIKDEIAIYLLRGFRDTDITISNVWDVAEYVKDKLNEDYMILRRKI